MRHKRRAVAARSSFAEGVLAIPAGTTCLAVGCSSADVTACHYVDGRGRRCETYWCPEHVRSVASQPYCPRHAGIVMALNLSARKGHRPDIDNRAPSLANWIGNDMDLGLRKILREVLDRHDAETIVVEPICYVFRAGNREHAWERTWTLANHAGITLRISIGVVESADAVVRVRVGERTLEEVVPPWVEHHRRREGLDPHTDLQERREFYIHLFDVIGEAVGQQRCRRLGLDGGPTDIYPDIPSASD